ncbi:peptidoglycan O-acetyltransferase [mine drainage metagenome]|uniref:Peptidoglycan O-acetyltransferase n=1 Tax=mine drainage metagenome TaxID=410659 RepID=A0A1J5RBM2_9ZZZZ
MLLSDIRYLAFLFIVVILYYVISSGKLRRPILLAASYYFYYTMSHVYIVILLAVTALTYFGALALQSKEAEARKGLLFGLLLGTVLTPLVVLKYSAFVLGAMAGIFGLSVSGHQLLSGWALPVGISFFTFAAVGYLIDVYLELIPPESRPLYMALFLAFFPLVTAGPIERGGRLIPQFDCDYKFSAQNGFAALRVIFWGLVLKLLIADNLAGQVNAFFSAAPKSAVPLERLFATVHYVFYLYADFAGYSLLAIGSAQLMGLKVSPNFQQPFLSATVPEFWRTWHISLSSWVRDYLFATLRTSWRHYRNRGMAMALIVSFLILGLWHGAGWGFILFGLMHGLLVTGSTFTLQRRNSFWVKTDGTLPVWLYPSRVVATFFFVTLTFVVFRAPSIQDAFDIYKGIFSYHFLVNLVQFCASFVFDFVHPLHFQYITGSMQWILIGILIIGDICVRKGLTLESLWLPVRFVAYNAGVILILYTWLSGNVAAPFLYYKF